MFTILQNGCCRITIDQILTELQHNQMEHYKKTLKIVQFGVFPGIDWHGNNVVLIVYDILFTTPTSHTMSSEWSDFYFNGCDLVNCYLYFLVCISKLAIFLKIF